MKIFITDNDGHLIPVDGKNAVTESNSGGTIEIAKEYGRGDVPGGISLQGGREPSPSLPFEEVKTRTEDLGIYPIAANVLHVFPYKLSLKE